MSFLTPKMPPLPPITPPPAMPEPTISQEEKDKIAAEQASIERKRKW